MHLKAEELTVCSRKQVQVFLEKKIGMLAPVKLTPVSWASILPDRSYRLRFFEVQLLLESGKQQTSDRSFGNVTSIHLLQPDG